MVYFLKLIFRFNIFNWRIRSISKCLLYAFAMKSLFLPFSLAFISFSFLTLSIYLFLSFFLSVSPFSLHIRSLARSLSPLTSPLPLSPYISLDLLSLLFSSPSQLDEYSAADIKEDQKTNNLWLKPYLRTVNVLASLDLPSGSLFIPPRFSNFPGRVWFFRFQFWCLRLPFAILFIKFW